MNTTALRVEFIGGPFDGHNQTISASRGEIASTVALPVNDNVFRMLDGKTRGPARPPRSVALYERSDENGDRYNYVGACSAASLNLENWRV